MAIPKLFIDDVELGGVDSFEFKVSADPKWPDDWGIEKSGYQYARDATFEMKMEWQDNWWQWFRAAEKITYRGPLKDIKVQQSGSYVREGSYLPEQLGLNMPGVNWIHIGRCYQYAEGDLTIFGNAIAHAHHETGNICMPDGLYVFSSPGVVDDVLIHEYCHILAGEDGHGEKWSTHMARYGLENYPWVNYVYR